MGHAVYESLRSLFFVFLSAVTLLSVQSQERTNEDAITGSLLRGFDKHRNTEHGGVST